MPYIDGDKLIQELSTMYKEPTSTEDFMTIGYDKAIADVVVTVHRQPTADVVEKERYDRLLENATIMDEALNEYQTADVAERKHGKWKKMWHSYFKQELPCCSVCGHFSTMRWKYCPNCGADMRKETEDED